MISDSIFFLLLSGICHGIITQLVEFSRFKFSVLACMSRFSNTFPAHPVHRISTEDDRDHVVIGVRKRSDFESRDRVRDTNRIDETNKLLQRVLELDS